MLSSGSIWRLGQILARRLTTIGPWASRACSVAPRVELRSRRQRVSVEGDLTAGYRTWQALAGLDMGMAFGPRSELRVGYEAGVLDARVRGGAPLPEDIHGVEHGARVRWVYDGHDDWFVPRSGTRIVTEARWLATVPGCHPVSRRPD